MKIEAAAALSTLAQCKFFWITRIYKFLQCKLRYQKMFKIKDIQFCIENLKMKRKKDKHFLTLQSGDLNPQFSKIPTHDLNYWRWWDQIQARKLKFLNFTKLKFNIKSHLALLWVRSCHILGRTFMILILWRRDYY